MTASATVVAAAMPIVRYAIERYALDVKMMRKLSSVQTCSISLVNGLICQNASMKRTASAAR